MICVVPACRQAGISVRSAVYMKFSQVKKNKQILEFIKQTDLILAQQGYSDHGIRHSQLVADRARTLSVQIGFSKKEQELTAIAAFCHDMGSFVGRTQHHYWGALLFHQIFQDENIEDVSQIMKAIVDHDKEEKMVLTNISAVVVLADKSDVHRSRVREKDLEKIKQDIHDRVNYAVTDSKLKINKNKKEIILQLKVDTNFCPVIEYFEIFTDRMTYCRKAADFLKYKFCLVINNFKLL